MIDFGQMKILRDETKLVFARLVIALYNNSKECIRCMQQLGLKLENTTSEVDSVLAYLLFDTRMDIKEAHALADILCHVNEVFQIEDE